MHLTIQQLARAVGKSENYVRQHVNRKGADPILTMEISNLPEIVCVYTTLCR